MAAGGELRFRRHHRLVEGRRASSAHNSVRRRARSVGRRDVGHPANWHQFPGHPVCLAAGGTASQVRSHSDSRQDAGIDVLSRGGLMKLGFVVFITAATAVLVGIAWVQSGGLKQRAMLSAGTPEEAVQALMSEIQAHDYQQAYASLDRSSGTDLDSFTRDVAGSDGSLRTYSSLHSADTSP